jgi:hypothetical protein
MRNREETDSQSSNGNIRTIKQRFYHAIDKFGEVHRDKLIVPQWPLGHSENFDFEFDVSGNLLSKCVYFPYVRYKVPYSPDIIVNTPLVRIRFTYRDNRLIEINANTSGIVEETQNYEYLRYFDLANFFSIPGDDYTEEMDKLVDINNSPIVKFEYNDSGMKIKETSLNVDGKVEKVTEFNYIDENKIKEVTVFDKENRILRKIIYKYNDEGLLIEIRDYGVDGLIKTRSDLFYYDGNRNVKQRTVFNKIGKIIDQYYFAEDGKLSQHDYNKYSNQKGKWSYYYSYHVDGNYEVNETMDDNFRKNTFDKHNNLIKTSNNASYTEFKYNENLLINMKIEFKAYGAVYKDEIIDKIVYQYKYDLFNNWIERVSYRNEMPFEIMTREITYF